MSKKFICPSCGWMLSDNQIPYNFRCPICHTDGLLFTEKIVEKGFYHQKNNMDKVQGNPSKRTLTLEECKEYVKNIKNLEISCYQLERLRDSLNYELQKAEVRKQELSSQKIKEPIKETIGTTILGSVLAFFPYGAVPGLAIGFIKGLGRPTLFLEMFKWALIIGGIISCTAFISLHVTSGGSKGYKKKNQDNHRKYEIAKQRHAENTIQNEALLQYIPNEIKKCEIEYNKAKDLLNQYYSLNFIYPKYRGMVPVCTIYEYLESGRCFSLLGHEGAYNLYENELRMNLIIEKLDDILNRLDEIQANQKVLVKEIKRSNAMIDNLSKSVENIEHNTALTQYYSEITANNTSYLAWLAYLDQKSVI